MVQHAGVAVMKRKAVCRVRFRRPLGNENLRCGTGGIRTMDSQSVCNPCTLIGRG